MVQGAFINGKANKKSPHYDIQYIFCTKLVLKIANYLHQLMINNFMSETRIKQHEKKKQ